MTQDQRSKPAGADGAESPMGNTLSTGSLQNGPAQGEVQDGVDPFDYAETIVRDLALHVGSRLRDFRADLTAMHSAVVQLPETMKITVLGQSVQDLRDRVATLNSVVNQHLGRPSEEVIRLAHGMTDLGQRLSGVESWITVARQSGGSSDMAGMPIPNGGFVAMDQFDRIVDQVHESLMRVVAAVREVQLDFRDLRTEVRGQLAAAGRLSAPVAAPVAEAAPVATPIAAPVATPVALPAVDPEAASRLAQLTARLDTLEARVGDAVRAATQAAAQAAASAATDAGATAAPAPVPAPAAAPAPAGTGDLAALVFGAWNRLGLPSGAESLARAVQQVSATVADRLGEMVKAPVPARGPGLHGVASGRVRGLDVVALVAVEDLCGRSWLVQADGTELTCPDPATTRAATWRSTLAAAALVVQARPGVRVVPVVVYGNGFLDQGPTAEEVAAFAVSIGAADAGRRLIQVAADDISLPGLISPADLPAAFTDAAA
ncbi:MAG: hypothetical protein RLY86_3642 [Pseudomonadota bacterium]|jgi:hypothetical protein